jgi:hypothetical protein
MQGAVILRMAQAIATRGALMLLLLLLLRLRVINTAVNANVVYPCIIQTAALILAGRSQLGDGHYLRGIQHSPSHGNHPTCILLKLASHLPCASSAGGTATYAVALATVVYHGAERSITNQLNL